MEFWEVWTSPTASFAKNAEGNFRLSSLGVSKMTTEQIRQHLQYRSENERNLAEFSPTEIFGTKDKLYYDASKSSFLISSRSDWRNGNPDIIPVSQVIQYKYCVD